MKQERKSLALNIIISMLIVVFLSLIASVYLPSFKVVNYREGLNIDQGVLTNVNNKLIISQNTSIYKEDNSEIFIPIDIVSEYIDKYIFWDEQENKLTITTENNVIRMHTEELLYFVNNEPLSLNIPVYNIDGVAYIPREFLTDFYNLNIDYNKETKIVDITFLKDDKTLAYISSKNAPLRFEPNKKSEIIRKLQNNETIYVLEKTENKYTKIKTSDGYIGYVKSSSISGTFTESGKVIEDTEEKKETWNVENGKINLVFDQITTVNANNLDAKRVLHDGVDVLVPTWFSFENENGDIVNIADKGYVNWAHKNGYQVWGLITDNFNSTISHAVLSSTDVREYVIKQLLAFVSVYNLDGINIDFESVPKTDGTYFVQFIRELAPLLKEQGAILSVDMFVPKSWTEHYNRKEVAKASDFIIVMGYDEHYAGSKESGSVASISWSKEAIVNTLAQNVPKEKLILGIPFYTRIWSEENINGKIELSSKAYGMESAYDFMKQKNGEFIWLEDVGQYYCEVKENNVTYKVWLEDETSLKKRLDLVLKYDIAGTGAWKRGLEKDIIWDILKQKLKTN